MKFNDSKLVRHTPDSLIFLIDGQGGEYEIEHDRMNTPARVLGWVRQLAAKNWVTKEHIRILVAVAEQNGVDIV